MKQARRTVHTVWDIHLKHSETSMIHAAYAGITFQHVQLFSMRHAIRDDLEDGIERGRAHRVDRCDFGRVNDCTTSGRQAVLG